MPDNITDQKGQQLTDLIGSDDLRSEMMARYKIVDRHYAPWKALAEEDFKFALGDQWTDEDKEILNKGGRPCLTFNRIRPLINLVSGYQRENSARIKVSPEGGEDKIFSEVCDKLIAFIDKTAKLNYKLGYYFDDGVICGKSYIEAMLTYDKDPVRGELQFNLLTPYQFLPDPEFKEYDLNDGCAYGFKVGKFTKARLKELFPNKAKIIDQFATDTDEFADNLSLSMLEGSNDDYGNKPEITVTRTTADQEDIDPELKIDMKFTLKEYWRPKLVEKYFVIETESGEPRKFDKNEDAEAFATLQGPDFIVIKRKVPEMWVADMVCGIILQDIKSPMEAYYSGYPYFRYMADWSPNAPSETLRVQGITRPLKDPQKEKNKSKSQTLHILNTQANSGWIGDDDAMTPDGWKKLETMGSKPGIAVKKKKGSELREILPKGPNQGHIQREMQADEEFKQISGINPDLMGFQEGTASGKAIAMRVKQAILSLSRIFTNYRYSKEIMGDFILLMIPLVFDAKKIMKVVGPDYMQKAVSERYPQGLSEGNIQAFLTMIKDNKYDVYVTEADAQQTIRYETFTQMVELVKAGVQIPPDVLIDFMDIPNSDEVLGKIQQAQAAAAAAQTANGPGAKK